MTSSKRPYIICHMVPSLDGRIVTSRWKEHKVLSIAHAEYERTAQTFHADAWMIGRVSMEGYTGKARKHGTNAPRIPRIDFIATHKAKSYAIALDPSGKLRWKSGSIDDEHVITVLTESVSDDYPQFLQSLNISYIFGGKKDIDLTRVLQTLRRQFGIEKLLLEGGGKINGSFLAANLIDELSVLLAPIADGSMKTPTLFDVTSPKAPARALHLTHVEKRRGGLIWLRYKLKSRP